MASPEDNIIQDLQQYNSEDAFDAFINVDFLKNEAIDMDLLKNEAMDEDVDINNMSNSDLFRYYLEGELHKEEPLVNGSPILADPISEMSPEFALLSSPQSSEFNQYTEANPLSPNSSISPTVTISEIQQQQQSLQSAPVDGGAVGTSLATLNAQLSELLAKLPLIKQESADGAKAGAGAASVSTPNKAVGAGATSRLTANTNGSVGASKVADDAPSDLKKLTSKERRQIRNKISARNFRVRRKEYITNLESTNQQQQEEIDLLRQTVQKLRDQNTKLQSEVEDLRKRQPTGSTAIANVSSPPSSPHGTPYSASMLTVPTKPGSSSNPRGKGVVQPQQPSSPSILIPNLNKDSHASAPAAKAYRDPRIRVQTMFLPEFSLDKHLFESKSPYAFAGTYLGGDKNIFSLFDTEKGHEAWLVFNMCTAVLQQMMTLFVDAVCAIPPQDMLPLLYPEAVYPPPEQTPVEQDTAPASVAEDCPHVQAQDVTSEAPESAIEASVLDWLYDNMVRQVIEQSQAEARLSDLTSDWVVDDFDDPVLHQIL